MSPAGGRAAAAGPAGWGEAATIGDQNPRRPLPVGGGEVRDGAGCFGGRLASSQFLGPIIPPGLAAFSFPWRGEDGRTALAGDPGATANSEAGVLSRRASLLCSAIYCGGKLVTGTVT